MKYLAALGRFVYDFVIGDDWKIAASIVVALAALAVATAQHWLGDTGLALLGGGLIVLAFAVSLVLDVRSNKH